MVAPWLEAPLGANLSLRSKAKFVKQLSNEVVDVSQPCLSMFILISLGGYERARREHLDFADECNQDLVATAEF